MDRQKLLLIFGGAWVSAALLTWFLYAKTVAPQSEKLIKVVAAARDMGAGTRLRKQDLRRISVVERDAPRNAVLDEAQVLDRVLLFPLSVNEPLTPAKLGTASGVEGVSATIEPGKRAIAVPFTDSTGVAGLIQPRSHVDVLFTRPGSMAEAITTTILEDIIVLSINRVTEAQPSPASGSGSTPAPAPSSTQQRSATLLVTPQEARVLELAKNQGRISLALRNPLDRSRLEEKAAIGAEVLDPEVFTRRLRGRTPGGRVPNLTDPRQWAQLTGEGADPPKPKPPPEKKEPPKPRAVVDVYRGDKHVQEIFP